VLVRQATGQVPGAVHTDGALEGGALGGILAGRQAHCQRVLGQDREDMGCTDWEGGACCGLTTVYHLLLRALMLTCGVGP